VIRPCLTNCSFVCELTYVQVCDLKALTAIAHDYGALVMVDNSIMTPVYQRPLELGADVSMISATKFVGGHSDVTGGILAFRDPALAKRYALTFVNDVHKCVEITSNGVQ
jgi:cystathionine beta-lyase/cystathionine gamma-synthase